MIFSQSIHIQRIAGELEKGTRSIYVLSVRMRDEYNVYFFRYCGFSVLKEAVSCACICVCVCKLKRILRSLGLFRLGDHFSSSLFEVYLYLKTFNNRIDQHRHGKLATAFSHLSCFLSLLRFFAMPAYSGRIPHSQMRTSERKGGGRSATKNHSRKIDHLSL